MSDKKKRKKIKIGINQGGGPPPGYLWNVRIIDLAFEEAMRILKEFQYDHMADQVRDIATEDDPTHSETVDVRPIEDFYEIRDKGGPLGNLNVRVFFFLDHKTRTIVICGAINKKNDGATPLKDKVRMRRRKRAYFEG